MLAILRPSSLARRSPTTRRTSSDVKRLFDIANERTTINNDGVLNKQGANWTTRSPED